MNNTCILILIAFVAVVLLVLYIFYLCNLHARVSRFEHKVAPHLVIIEREIHGIGCYMRIIVGIAILFCVGICIHYIAVFYPRFTTINDHKNYVSSIGVDYWGIIVGFMALLVTLLVGWQIFSNISERDRVNRIVNENNEFQKGMNDSRTQLNSRIQELQKCCEQRGKQIKELNSKVEYMSNGTLLVLSAKGLLKSANFDNKEKRTDAYLVSMAYVTLYQALYQFICAKSDIRNIRGCISELKTCIMMMSFDDLQFIKEHYDSACELYRSIKAKTNVKEILSELNEINIAQGKIGWNEIFEKSREYLKNPKDDDASTADTPSPETESKSK